MEMKNIPFATTDWTTVEAVEIKGETGTGYWKTREFDTINVHMVSCCPNSAIKSCVFNSDVPVVMSIVLIVVYKRKKEVWV